MTITWVAVVVAAVVAILAVGYLVAQQQRRRRLQERFGPEYERTVRERENRREAEQELLEREQRHAKLDIRPLSAESRSSYSKKWTEVQERFVDAPGFAVTEADHLVTSVMADRGYPTEGFEQQVSDLSVAHGQTLDRYRKAHEISSRAARREASTEELRQAMVHYRALFQELLEDAADIGAERREAEDPRDERRRYEEAREERRDVETAREAETAHGERQAYEGDAAGRRADGETGTDSGGYDGQRRNGAGFGDAELDRQQFERREQDRRQYGGQEPGGHASSETGTRVAGGQTYRNAQGS
ncbi:hypothetical protein ABZT47_24665 [Sphaerisporangium sp. NPDC005289]|uniref:hypothetical protein n=1 Tax=Sphaerisporangium sp. NPDC005289 TaxID=3155247 RepID=UPI0033B1C52C